MKKRKGKDGLPLRGSRPLGGGVLFRLVKVDVLDIVVAVSETFEDDCESGSAARGEDVCQEAVRVVLESDEDEEHACFFWATNRVIGEVGVAVFDDAFVGSNHCEMF